MNFGKYVLQRFGIMALTLWVIITVTFILLRLLPGSPWANPLELTPEQLAILNEQAGFDRPILEQYFIYLGNLLRGNLGVSFQFRNQPVTALLAGRIGPSIQLGLQALLFGTVVGTILGLTGAVKRASVLDSGSTITAVIGRSVPAFVAAALLQYIVAVRLGWLPIAGWASFAHTILPTIALSLAPMADAARFVRTEMVEQMSSDQAEFARSKGLSKWQVAGRHGLRNSTIPMMTLLGPMAVALLTGSLVVENIFAVPGIGEQFIRSILTNDYPTIMAVTILYSALLLLVIFLVDILYSIVDPRVRLGGARR